MAHVDWTADSTAPVNREGAVRSRLNETIPDSWKLPVAQQAPSGTTTQVKLQPVQSTYGTGAGEQRIMRFRFDNNALQDFRRAYIVFNATITASGGGGTYSRFAQGIWSVVNRLRIKGQMELEDIHKYNLLYSLLHETMTEPDVDSNMGSLWGIGTTGDRNGWASGRDYCLPVFSGFLSQGILPLSLIHDKLELEIYLEEPNACIETDYSTYSYTITDIHLVYDRLTPSRSIAGQLQALVNSGQYAFFYRSFANYHSSLSVASAQVQIHHRSDVVDGYFTIMRTTSTLNSPTTNDKFLTYNYNNCNSYQLRHNNVLVPDEAIDTTDRAIQAYMTLLRYLGRWKLRGVFTDAISLTPSAYINNRFIIVNDVRAFPMDPELVNSRGTQQHAVDTIIHINLNSAPAAQTVDTFVLYQLRAELAGGIFHRAY